jgi:hypothetical protein
MLSRFHGTCALCHLAMVLYKQTPLGKGLFLCRKASLRRVTCIGRSWRLGWIELGIFTKKASRLGGLKMLIQRVRSVPPQPRLSLNRRRGRRSRTVYGTEPLGHDQPILLGVENLGLPGAPAFSGVQSTTFTRSCQMLFPFLMSTYSRLSARACQLASMMLGELPTVLQMRSPSLESINTRVCAAVPASPSRMRTL